MVFYIDRPTEVKIGVFVISFYSISEQTMVIRYHLIHLYLTHSHYSIRIIHYYAYVLYQIRIN